MERPTTAPRSMMAPTKYSPLAAKAEARGAEGSSWRYGTRPVSTVVTPMYSTAQVAREARIPRGRSL